LNDFRRMTHVEIIHAQNEKIKLWHLQNVVNANFFASVHSALGTKLKDGSPITRQHLYMLPNEEMPENGRDYLDASTEEGREEINRRIALTK